MRGGWAARETAPWVSSVPYSGPVSAPDQRRARWDLAAAVTILVAVGLRAYLLSQAWFWQDDFLHAARAIQSGLDAQWVFQSYNGHLKPAFFLQTWLTTQAVGMSWPLAVAMVLLWTAAFGASFWFLVTGIFGRGPASLLALGLACLTPLWSVTSSWFASAMESLPTLTLTVLSAACVVRLVASGRPAWGAAALVSYVGALLWYEKALLGVLLIAFAVAAMILGGRASALRSRASLVTATAFALITAAYVTVFVLLSGVPAGSAGADPGQAAQLAYEMVLSVIPTGLLGGPWQQNSDGSTLQVLITQPWIVWIWAACITVVGIGWWRHRRSAILAVAGVVVVVVPLVWLVARARLDFLGPVIGRDTRYVVDLVPIAGLALALLIAGGSPSVEPRIGAGPRRALGWAAPLLVIVYALVTWPSVYAVAASRASLAVDTWVGNALASLAEHPDRVVVDGLVPPRVLTPDVGDAARAASVLAPFGVPKSRFDMPAAEWWRIGDNGTLEPALFVPLSEPVEEIASGCAVPVRGQPVAFEIPLLQDSPGSGVPAVRIGWYSSQTLVPIISSGGERWEFPLVDGLGYIVFPIDAIAPVDESTGELIIGGLGPEESLCVTGIAVGVMG